MGFLLYVMPVYVMANTRICHGEIRFTDVVWVTTIQCGYTLYSVGTHDGTYRCLCKEIYGVDIWCGYMMWETAI